MTAPRRPGSCATSTDSGPLEAGGVVRGRELDNYGRGVSVADLGFFLAVANLIAVCGWLGFWIPWKLVSGVHGETADLKRARSEISRSLTVVVPIAVSIVLSVTIFVMVILNDGTGG